jgi:phosphoadenosine phosphosulfate reductase
MNIIDTLNMMSKILEKRDDFFITTSFGFQSAILFFLFDLLKIKPDTVYVKTGLTTGDTENHKKKIQELFDFNLIEYDRQDFLKEQIKGREFLDLPQDKRQNICREIKRRPLMEYIEKDKKNIWISGIRKSQTSNRRDVQFINTSDMGVVKISPLANFSDSDLLNISKKYSLPLNEDYKDLCKANPENECGLHI